MFHLVQVSAHRGPEIAFDFNRLVVLGARIRRAGGDTACHGFLGQHVTDFTFVPRNLQGEIPLGFGQVYVVLLAEHFVVAGIGRGRKVLNRSNDRFFFHRTKMALNTSLGRVLTEVVIEGYACVLHS